MTVSYSPVYKARVTAGKDGAGMWKSPIKGPFTSEPGAMAPNSLPETYLLGGRKESTPKDSLTSIPALWHMHPHIYTHRQNK